MHQRPGTPSIGHEWSVAARESRIQPSGVSPRPLHPAISRQPTPEATQLDLGREARELSEDGGIRFSRSASQSSSNFESRRGMGSAPNEDSRLAHHPVRPRPHVGGYLHRRRKVEYDLSGTHDLSRESD